jgi:anti-sigma B factor antagonist
VLQVHELAVDGQFADDPLEGHVSNLRGGVPLPDRSNERKARMELGLDVTERNGYAVLAVRGEVDVYTAPRLRERLVELVSQGKHQIVVDLEGVDFLDSTGLGVLVGGLKRLRSHDGDLTLVCTQHRILKVFEITGLTKVFSIHDSVDAAVGGE